MRLAPSGISSSRISGSTAFGLLCNCFDVPIGPTTTSNLKAFESNEILASELLQHKQTWNRYERVYIYIYILYTCKNAQLTRTDELHDNGGRLKKIEVALKR